MRYNMRKIMVESHRLQKKYRLSLSESLKVSWTGEKSSVPYEEWKRNKIDAMKAWNGRYAFKVAYDISPGKYISSRKAVQAQTAQFEKIENLNFADM